MKRLVQIITALLMTYFPGFGQESPLHSLNTTKNNKDRITALINTSDIYRLKPGEAASDLEKARQHAVQAMQLSKESAFPELFAQAAKSYTLALREADQLDKAATVLPELQNYPLAKLEVLSIVAWGYALKPDSEKHDLDISDRYSAEQITLGRLQRKTSFIEDGLLLQSLVMIERNDLHQAKERARSLNGNSQITLYRTIAEKYAFKETEYHNADSAAHYLQLAATTAASIKNVTEEFNALQVMGVLGFNNPEQRVYEETLLSLTGTYKKSGYPHLHHIYKALSTINAAKGNKNQQLYYIQEAIKCMQKTKEFSHADEYYRNLGEIYRMTGEHEKALECYEEALSYLGPSPDHNHLYSVKEGMCVALRKMQRYQEALRLMQTLTKNYPPGTLEEHITVKRILVNIYRDMKDYEKAEKLALELVSLSQHHPTDLTVARLNLGQLYVEWEKYDKARPYLQYNPKHVRIAVDSEAHFHYMMFKVDSAAGNYISAIRHLMTNKKLDDSIMTAAKQRQIQEYKIIYETEKKDHDLLAQKQNILLLEQQSMLQQKDLDRVNLKLMVEESGREQARAQANEAAINLELTKKNMSLLKKDAELQQARLRQANIITNATISAIVLLLLILALIVNSYFSKQRKNKEISQKNEKLQHLVKEKEWLLQEVHHRVKNNLQTVVSLLESQSGYLDNEALQAITESRNRVYAMSLIHQKLYRETSVASINMAVYLPELIEHLRTSFTAAQNLQFDVQVSPVEVDVSQAIPLGLILNEAITNAIKYAFPSQRNSNRIRVWLQPMASKDVELLIADNGIGMKGKTGKGLGLKLIHGLASEIDGDVTIDSEQGTCIKLFFTPTLQLQMERRQHITTDV
ncbi:histidine kinase dimerization/phosphoacceptor domain -containing protein [uncultured Chitinophaga sp.]|uniref:tetratricopeptide repeat-containing sensor histidine kinase n=1 Tax=uncultured Chitinophaga sp. TaxID=339340 RepID=UPI0025CBF324|nr:histidine kinase dimerization/phosphoacceptor domain -containing protein [uncultured Chitinophaga sp.]